MWSIQSHAHISGWYSEKWKFVKIREATGAATMENSTHWMAGK